MVCSPRFGNSTIEVQDIFGVTIESATCAPSGVNPGKAYFTNFLEIELYKLYSGYSDCRNKRCTFLRGYEDVDADQDEKLAWACSGS